MDRRLYFSCRIHQLANLEDSDFTVFFIPLFIFIEGYP